MSPIQVFATNQHLSLKVKKVEYPEGVSRLRLIGLNIVLLLRASPDLWPKLIVLSRNLRVLTVHAQFCIYQQLCYIGHIYQVDGANKVLISFEKKISLFASTGACTHSKTLYRQPVRQNWGSKP